MVVTMQAQAVHQVIESRFPFESKTVKGLPYSAEFVSETIQTLSDGNRIVQKTTGRVYRDSEGRVRREEDRPSGSPRVSITDVVSHRSVTLNTERSEATQLPMPLTLRLNGDQFFLTADGNTRIVTDQRETRIVTDQSGVPGGRGAAVLTERLEQTRAELGKIAGVLLPAGREEFVEEKLQDRVIGGIVASGIRRTTTIPPGAIGNERPIQIVSEEWSSPDLQVLVTTDHTDPRSGHSTYQLSNINRNEPNPALFQIPADFTIRRNGIK
jgi:hypothetical protein